MEIKLVNKEDNTITIGGICRITKKHHEVTVPLDGFELWNNGDELIQRAMPDVSADDREFLISEISPEGWDKMATQLGRSG